VPTPGPGGEDPHHHHLLAHLAGADDGLPIDPDLDPGDPAEPSRTHRPAAERVHRLHPTTLAAIGLGGFVGAWGRYELGLAWPTTPNTFPVTTFVINTSGAFLLGLVLTLLVERVGVSRLRDHIRHFGCVGVLGSWTTMSALAVETDALVHGGKAWVALVYVAATVVAGVAAVAAGIAIGRLGRGTEPGAEAIPALEAPAP
jgi:fluoride exporter